MTTIDVTSTAVSSPEKSDASLRSGREGLVLLVSAMASGGAIVLALALQRISTARPTPSLLVAAVFVTAFAFADSKILALRFGHNQHMFTWSEAAVVAGVLLLPFPWLVVLAAAGLPVGYALSRSAPVKAVFNTSGIVVGLSIAAAVFAAAGGHVQDVHNLQTRSLLPAVLACLAFFTWNSVTVALAVAVSQHMRFWRVYTDGLGLSFFVWAGNTLAGIFAVVIADTVPAVLAFAPGILALLAYSYRSSLRAKGERDAWQTLEAASREIAQLQTEDMAFAVLERSQDLFKADHVELLLVDVGAPGGATVFRTQDGATTSTTAADPAATTAYWPRALDESALFVLRRPDAAPAAAAHLATLGVEMCFVAPLRAKGNCFGALCIAFEGPVQFSPRELKMLSTFGNQVAVAAQNARLFEEVGEEHTKLARIVDGSSDGIIALDASGLVSVWNPAMEDITGTSAVEATGRALPDVLDAVDEDGVPWDARSWMAALAPGGRTSLVVVTGAGGPRCLQLSAGRLSRTSARSQTAVLIARDVTAARKLEAAKQDFVATVSHELRTPVTCLRGFVDTMLRPEFPLDREMVDDQLVRMRRQAKRLERLVEDVLDVSVIERGELTFSIERVRVPDVVTRVVEDTDSVDGTQPVVVEVTGGEATAWADPLRLEQVLTNLVSNARRYSPTGTSIGLTVEAGPDEVRVSVRDEGPGIAPEHQELVFERFARLGNHLNRVQGGAGLGLYISRQIVEVLGGEIGVDSAPGDGATFWFTVPTTPKTADLRASSSF